MAETVFILGAGASKEGGAPTMPEFLGVSREIERRKKGAHFETVFRAVGALQAVHSKATMDLVNVESVFASFELARIIGRFPGHEPEQIQGLVDAMKRVIADTIEETLEFSVHQTDGLLPPRPYRPFAEKLKRLHQAKRTVAILTFNYDVAIDYALHKVGLPFGYGLATDKLAGVPLLKLHGSLNWGRCSKCGEVSPYPIEEYLRARRLVSPTELTRFCISLALPEHAHCDRPMDAEPVLVPPVWNKSEYHASVKSVWQAAAKELEDAENIIVVGYSLPDSDGFFRSLYALGSVGPRPLRRFWVVNPDKSGAVENRFRQLLGPGAEQRFRYISLTFREAQGALEDFVKESSA